jgi:UDPglucose 6-dehydrogenase
MKIGIIGIGVVGGALQNGFEHQGFDVAVHDTKLSTTIAPLMDTEVVYICVPTPPLPEGGCDTGIIEGCVDELINMGYTGVIAIKSTVAIGTTQELINRYHNKKIAFVPEFMKERSANYDFLFDNDLLIIGAGDMNVSDIIIRSHGKICKKFLRMTPTEAETLKYMHNSFGAMRVVFANMFYALTQQFDDVDYTKVKNGFVEKNNLPDEYMDVNAELRGYAGACFPKDMAALASMCKQKGVDFDIIPTVISDNEKLRKTTFAGMRDE